LWKPLDADIGEYLDLGAELKMERNTELSRQMEFWKEIRGKDNQQHLSEQPITTLYDKIAIER
jgi:hypothetical protein